MPSFAVAQGNARDDRRCTSWTRQFATIANAMAIDASGNVFVAGEFTATPREAELRKYGPTGSLSWSRQIGTVSEEAATAVAVDLAGNVFVAGLTGSSLAGQPRVAQQDVFVQKYDAAGTLLWTRQFGTIGDDRPHDLAIDPFGDVIVAGIVNGTALDGGALPGQANLGGLWDAFVRKYSASGTVMWTRQFGTTENELVTSVAIDTAGNVVVAGRTSGALPGQVRNEDSSTPSFYGDPYVRKYDASGNELWTRQFGTTRDDSATDVAVDGANNVIVVGETAGTLAGSPTTDVRSAFVKKFDSAGTPSWSWQFGGGAMTTTRATAVTIDRTGALVLGGSTTGALAGQTRAGGATDTDAFIQRRDASGAVIWSGQFGTTSADETRAVAVDGTNRIFAIGVTAGALPNQTSTGGQNGFVLQLAP